MAASAGNYVKAYTGADPEILHGGGWVGGYLYFTILNYRGGVAVILIVLCTNELL